MKRLITAGLALMLVFLMSGVALAVDVKAKGYWWMEAVSRNNWDFLGGEAATGEDSTFSIEQKLRTAFYFTANENLRAVLDTQIGTNNWGNGLYGIGAGRSAGTSAANGANTAGNGNIMLRKAYIEYKLPNTMVNLSVGFQTVTLPAAFGGGSAIFDDQVAAAVVSAPITENISITAGYARPYDANTAGATQTVTGSGTSSDVLFAAVPVKFGNYSITPFAAYANAGYQSVNGNGATSLGGYAGPNSSNSDGLRGYWGGAAFTGTVAENFKIMSDFNYGKVTYNTGSTNGGRSGFLFDAAVDYTGLSMMTPELFFTYSSGEDGNSTTHAGKSGRMPVIALPQNWAIGSFFFGERYELAGFVPGGGYTRATLGYWALGMSLKDITFTEKLSHTFNLLYAKGTNSKDYLYEAGGNVRNANYGGFLTEKDSLWEVDFNSRYKIYDELTAYLYLGYVHAMYDKDTWGASSISNAADIRNHAASDAYKIGLGLNYFF